MRRTGYLFSPRQSVVAYLSSAGFFHSKILFPLLMFGSSFWLGFISFCARNFVFPVLSIGIFYSFSNAGKNWNILIRQCRPNHSDWLGTSFLFRFWFNNLGFFNPGGVRAYNFWYGTAMLQHLAMHPNVSWTLFWAASIWIHGHHYTQTQTSSVVAVYDRLPCAGLHKYILSFLFLSCTAHIWPSLLFLLALLFYKTDTSNCI